MLDPFYGSGTTLVAAERLGRQWVGIDINQDAYTAIQARLQDEVRMSMDWLSPVRFSTGGPTRTDKGSVACPDPTPTESPDSFPEGSSKAGIKATRIEQYGLQCRGCFESFAHADYLELDHVVPSKAGGSDNLENRTILCGPCNQLKGSKWTLPEIRAFRAMEGRIKDPQAWEKTRQWENPDHMH